MSLRTGSLDSYWDLTRALNEKLPRVSSKLDKLLIELPEDALVAAAKEFGRTPLPPTGSNTQCPTGIGSYNELLASIGYCRITMNTQNQLPSF